jgi:hypothetical protein
MLLVLSVLVAETTPADPLSLFTSLGVAGLVAVTMFLWQRDTAKQRDAAMKLNSEFAEGLRELKAATDRSTDAHKASADAVAAMTQAMRGMPPQEMWYAIKAAVERKQS